MGVHHGVNSSKILRDPETCMKWCVTEDEFKGTTHLQYSSCDPSLSVILRLHYFFNRQSKNSPAT